MDITAFILVGLVTGIGSVLLLFRFDGAWLKALSLSGGSSILIAEFLAFAELLNISDENRSVAFVSLLGGWLVSFVISSGIMLLSLKQQNTKYKIGALDILLGDKTVIANFYQSKKDEVSKQIEEYYDLNKLKELKETLNNQELKIKEEIDRLNKIKDEADKILDKKHTLKIPANFDYPVSSDFFEVLPRYVNSISLFNHHLSSFTEFFITEIKDSKNKRTEVEILKTYLTSVSYYIGQYLFEWRDVRVHFRILNTQAGAYEKYIATCGSGKTYNNDITSIPINEGLINLAAKTKRSVVRSANQDVALDTENAHIWKDYITMVFEKIQRDGKPILSLGVSVKHQIDHKDMLYFLSYIQIEQMIQEHLETLDENFSICNAVVSEAA